MKQLSCLLLLFLIAGIFCKGTLYLNRITGNVDPITGYSPVYVECVVFTEDEIILDFINGLQGDGTGYGAGTYIEGSNNNRGSLTIPGNLHVKGTGTVDGWTYANGGIYCDDMVDTDDDDETEVTYYTLFDDDDSRILKNDDDALDDDVFDYSFTVEDNTGVTTVVGIIYPNGGIKVGDDLFTVQDNTGRTEVAGLTRPDGGITVNHDNNNDGNNVYWSVRTDGYLFARGNVSVEQDFYLGSDKSELRFFERFPRSGTGVNLQGASTTFHGQDAAEVGGNLVFIPGFGTKEFAFHSNGAIYLGRVGRQGDFFIQRQTLDVNYSNDDYAIPGGQTIFSGQDSSANGGNLRIAAGDATGQFTGGDIILATGLGNSAINAVGDNLPGSQINGNIQLGPSGFSPDYGQRLNFDLHITRPPITDASDAGDTIILGQLTRTAGTSAGDLIFTAGNGPAKAGDLYLQPGEAHESAILATEDQGVIYVGGFETNFDLLITRFGRSSGAATPGDFIITGQNSVDGNGGDIYFVTGGGGESTTAAILHLQVGSGGTSGGDIIWDTQLTDANFPDDLYIKREPTVNAGTFTSIQGQRNTNTPATGGSLNIRAGNGATFGGAVNFFGGKGHGSNGGSVSVTAADGSTTAGSIFITAGGSTTATQKRGGSITIWPGNGNPLSTGQNLVFSAGSGTVANKFNNGDVVFSSSRQTLVYVPFVLFQRNNGAFSNSFVNTFEIADLLHISATSPNLGFFSRGAVFNSATRVLRPRLSFSQNVHEPFFVPQEDGISTTNELNAMVQEIYNGLLYHGFFLP